MKVEEILDYKLKKLLKDKVTSVTEEDKKFILAQAKTKIQAYCHRRDMPKGIYNIWVDMAIEVLKGIDSSLFKVDITTEEEMNKRVKSISTGDASISLGDANDSLDTGYKSNEVDDNILNSFTGQLQAFRKFAAGNGDGLNGI